MQWLSAAQPSTVDRLAETAIAVDVICLRLSDKQLPTGPSGIHARALGSQMDLLSRDYSLTE